LLHAADFAPVHAMWQVIAVRLAEAGFNIDDQVMDQATVVTRRNNREAPDKGGWSLLIANAPAADHLSPMVALGLRTGAAAWIGWPTDPAVELLREKWIDSADPDEQKRLAGEIQGIALADVLYSPLGHYLQKSAWRWNISGIPEGVCTRNVECREDIGRAHIPECRPNARTLLNGWWLQRLAAGAEVGAGIGRRDRLDIGAARL
jgi:peptide/nickel transport system substrate-binding protein